MIYLPIILFALAAVLGVTIFLKWLEGNRASKAVIYSHGAAAAVALVLLIIYAVRNPGSYPQLALILFIAAALGGFALFFADSFADKRLIPVAAVHALVAVGGFVLLLMFAFA